MTVAVADIPDPPVSVAVTVKVYVAVVSLSSNTPAGFVMAPLVNPITNTPPLSLMVYCI